MFNKTLERKFSRMLEGAGVEINGKNPWDIQVKNPNLYWRILSAGSLGLGEAYMEGWWDCEQVDEFITRVLDADLYEAVKKNPSIILFAIVSRIFNLQTLGRAFQVAEAHYDLDNDFFEKMLDRRMIYTCGYWKNAKNLEEAEEHKLDLICKKAGLKPGMKVLDIGCGWGGFAKYAVEKYGVEVVGVTVSKEQAGYARKSCKGLPIEIRLQDYRLVEGTFDRVISIGMFEAVGNKNYRTFMKKVHEVLKDDGIFVLHTIGGNKSTFFTDPWVDKYIFPNGMLPSIKQIGASTERLFVMEDWHNFGTDYDKTLLAWEEDFERIWPQFKAKYGEKFYRMWRYYLLMCAGTFRSRKNQLWQIVFSKEGGLREGFKAVDYSHHKVLEKVK